MPLSTVAAWNPGVATAPLAPKWIRPALALVYASALVWMPRSDATARILLIAPGWPLIFRLVPRNWLYGMRTPHTLFRVVFPPRLACHRPGPSPSSWNHIGT
jgi:hypothetical protein